MDIILASTSKIRRNILINAGVKFSAIYPEIDESKARNSMLGFSAQETAIQLAKLKSSKISNQYSKSLVIAADQVLGFRNQIFNKPTTRAEIENQLLKLRNATHTLYSALSCATAGVEVWSHCSEARLTMRNFSREFLSSYLDSNSEGYLSSVGGYKLEEIGIQLFDKIEGDYFTILGLPILPLLAFLRQQEFILS